MHTNSWLEALRASQPRERLLKLRSRRRLKRFATEPREVLSVGRRCRQNSSSLTQDDSSWVNATADDRNLEYKHMPQPVAHRLVAYECIEAICPLPIVLFNQALYLTVLSYHSVLFLTSSFASSDFSFTASPASSILSPAFSTV